MPIKDGDHHANYDVCQVKEFVGVLDRNCLPSGSGKCTWWDDVFYRGILHIYIDFFKQIPMQVHFTVVRGHLSTRLMVKEKCQLHGVLCLINAVDAFAPVNGSVICLMETLRIFSFEMI